MAELKKGDKVRWRSGGGGRASGTVERVITSKVKVGGRSVSGTKKEPRYLVRNADTGKAVVLKRPSLQKSGGRGAARKGGKAAAGKAAPKRAAAGRTRRRAAKPKPEPPPPAATAAEAEQKTQVLKPPPKWPRWAAAGGLVAAVLVVGGLLLANDDDDDGGDDAEPAATVETTTATTAAEPTPELIAALESRPLALSGIETIPADRLGDDQENLAQQFDAAYDRVLAGLSELEQASAGDPEIAALATYVTDQVEIERAITDAFVRDSFSEGDPASVLAEKTARTERTLRRQISAAEALEAPPEAADLQRAFNAARRANLTYLEDLAAAIDAGDQAALDAALRGGRAASARAGRQIAAAARALQDETQASVAG